MSKTFKMENGDTVINRSSGQVVEVSDKSKLSQDVQELILIDVQTDNGFGAGLDSMVGTLPVDDLSPSNVNFEFRLRLRRAFDRMKQLQRRFQFGARPLTELIDRTLIMRAEPDRTNPTLYRFKAAVINMAGKATKLGGEFSLNSFLNR